MGIWIPLLPSALIVLGLLVVPGFVLARLFRISWPAAVLVSAPLGAAFIALLTLLFPYLGVFWSFHSVLIAIGVLVIAGAGIEFALRLRLKRQNQEFQGTQGHEETGEPEPSGTGEPKQVGTGESQEPRAPMWLADVTPAQVWAALLGIAIFAVAQGLASLPAMGSPQTFPALGDAVFHFEGIQIVAESGYASPLGPFEFIYGVSDGGPNYPTLFHALAATVVPYVAVVPAGNAAALVVGLIVWPLGLSAFASALRPGSAIASLVAPLLAIPIALVPQVYQFSFAVYPLVLSAGLLGGALALVVGLLRTPSVSLALAALLATVGVAAGQPATALIVLLVAVVWVVLWWVRGILERVKNGDRGKAFGVAGVGLLAIVLVLLVVPRIPLIAGLNQRPTESVSYWEAILALASGARYALGISLFVFASLLAALVGAWLSRRSRPALTMTWTAIALVALYVIASGPESYLRAFTSPWWKDATRFAIYLIIFVAGFAGYAVAALAKWVGERWPSPFTSPAAWVAYLSVGTGALVVIFPQAFLGVDEKLNFVADSYSRVEGVTVAINEDELALIEAIDDYLEPGTVVVGDPDSGVAWISVLTDSTQLQGLRYPLTADQAYLGLNFADILDDPKVCELVDQYDIRAFIQSDSPTAEFAGRYPGYNSVDTSEGFELLHTVGGASLYRITACN
mgnify:CR=1 FL=1